MRGLEVITPQTQSSGQHQCVRIVGLQRQPATHGGPCIGFVTVIQRKFGRAPGCLRVLTELCSLQIFIRRRDPGLALQCNLGHQHVIGRIIGGCRSLPDGCLNGGTRHDQPGGQQHGKFCGTGGYCKGLNHHNHHNGKHRSRALLVSAEPGTDNVASRAPGQEPSH